MHFYSSVDSVADFSYFNSSDYNFFPDSFRLLFHSARDELLFRFVTDLPVEISDDPNVAAHLQPTYSFLNSGPSLNLSIPQAQDSHWCEEESLTFQQVHGVFRLASTRSMNNLSQQLYVRPIILALFRVVHCTQIMADSHWGYDTDETMPPDSELGNEVNVCDSGSVTVCVCA